MGKINIGGELNPIYGRIGAAEHIYDYTNNKTQEKINTMLLNEIFSFSLGLKIDTIINGIDGNINTLEYEGRKVNGKVSWNILRKHFGTDYVLNNITCPNGLILSLDNVENLESVEEMTEHKKWSKDGEITLKIGRGITTATMKMDLEDGFSIIETAKFYHIPPIYFGFSSNEEIPNPKIAFENKLVAPTLSKKRLTLINETGEDAYFYICIPKELGITSIEVTSSGFKVPFDKVISENSSATDLDYYDCWRNPTGSRVLAGSKIEYDIK